MPTNVLTFAETPFDQLEREAVQSGAIARALLQDEHLAEDAVQQSWLALLETPPQDTTRVTAWFGTVCQNAARTIRRARLRRDRRENEVGALPSNNVPEPAAIIDRDEALDAVREAVDRLGEPYRRTIRMRYFDSLRPDEIAALEQVSISTVRSRLQRGKGELRNGLSRRFGGDPRTLCAALLTVANREAPAGPATPIFDWSPLQAWRPALRSHQVAAIAAAVALGTVSATAWWILAASPASEQAVVAEVVRVDSTETTTEDLSLTRRDVTPPRPNSALATVDDALVVTIRRAANDATVEGIRVRALAWGATDPERAWFEATTDADGIAQLPHLPTGDVALFAARCEPIEIDVDPTRSSAVTIMLPRGIDLSGVVRDVRGRPVTGASLWLSTHPTAPLESIGTTNDDGRFDLVDIPPGGRVGATEPSNGPSPMITVDGAIGERVETTLKLGQEYGSIAGRIEDPYGGAVSGATVRFDLDTDLSPEVNPTTPVSGISAADGTYRLVGAPSGAGTIRVTLPGYPTIEKSLTLGPGGDDWRVLRLVEGGTISGRVEYQDGRPGAGCVVRTDTDAPSGVEFTFTDRSGNYQLSGLAVGTHTLLAGGGSFEAARQVSVLPGDQLSWNPILIPSPPLQGRVVDHRQTPIPGASIRVVANDVAPLRSLTTTTSRSGEFSLPIAESSYPVSIRVRVGDQEIAHRLTSRPFGPLELESPIPPPSPWAYATPSRD